MGCPPTPCGDPDSALSNQRPRKPPPSALSANLSQEEDDASKSEHEFSRLALNGSSPQVYLGTSQSVSSEAEVPSERAFPAAFQINSISLRSLAFHRTVVTCSPLISVLSQQGLSSRVAGEGNAFWKQPVFLRKFRLQLIGCEATLLFPSFFFSFFSHERPSLLFVGSLSDVLPF